MKIRIIFVVTGLSTGGAEIMLLKLLERLDRERFTPLVISLTTSGVVGARIEALGISVDALGLNSSRPNPLLVLKLALRLRRLHPDVVQTWMYHADLLGGLAARLAGIRHLVWGIRNSDLDPNLSKWSTRAIVKCCAAASRWLPTRILSCSAVAQRLHVALGYEASKFVIIPNGFDVSRFRPDAAHRAALRAELGLPWDAPLVGIVGRFDPMKNHPGFIQAAGWVRAQVAGVHFVMIGARIDTSNELLLTCAGAAGVAGVLHLLGLRDDMPRLMAAFDVLVSSSSYGEAFPNVLGEAMACGVPCVVTDVGDSALIVGDTGRVVNVGDMRGLADQVVAVLNLPASERHTMGERARAHVEQCFELGQVVRQFENLYVQLVGK